LLTVTLGPAAGLAEAKKAKNKTVDITQAPGVTIPDASAAAFGQVDSTIAVGKQFKGLKIRDVNVTVQTTGSTATAAGGLVAQLSSPSGASTLLFVGLSGQSVGPLTLDDESFLTLGGAGGQASKFKLFSPYIGTAQPGNFTTGKPLKVMDGDNARGTWTLRMFDQGVGGVNVLNSWRLEVRTRRPYVTD
jgi:subtilisin-like proprotein convertase family protein